MMYTLYFVQGSCALGSMIVLEWSGSPYKLCRVEKEQHKSEAFLAVSPLGQVPTLDVDGRIITESSAILHHLGRLKRHGVPMMPVAGSPEHDRFNQILSFLTSSFHPAFAPLFHVDRFADTPDAQGQVTRKAVETIQARYAHLEELLRQGEGRLLLGRTTVADAYLFGVARWGSEHLDIEAEFPGVGAFQRSMAEDPAVSFALAVESGAPAQSAGGFKGLVDLPD